MAYSDKTVLLSFDAEEFDVPFENGVAYSLEEGMAVSNYGIEVILDLLKRNQVHATFFCTGTFAQHASHLIQRMVEDGHEIACHGVDHLHPRETDPFNSKEMVEQVSGSEIKGYRQPRMFPVKDEDILQAGFKYDSSLNPTCIPGRYMHLKEPRTWFKRGDLIEVPASVTPWFRFPLFWLSLHNLPLRLYCRLALRTLKKDSYFITYFHPWEFYPLYKHPEFKLSGIIRRNSGEKMASRLERLVHYLRDKGASFSTISAYLSSQGAEL